MADEAEERLEVPVEVGAADLLCLEADGLLQTGEVEAALRCLEEADGLQPGHGPALDRRVRLLLDLQRSEDAKALLERNVQRVPSDAEAHAKLGRLLYAMQEYDAALSCFHRAEQHGGSPNLYFDQGKCALRLARWAQAERCFTADIERDRPGDMSYWNRHVARVRQGKLALACADLDVGLAMGGSDEVAVRMLSAKRDLCLELDQPELAVAAMSALVDRFGAFMEAHVEQAELMEALGDRDRAEQAWAEALRKAEHPADVLVRRGAARLEAGLRAQALDDYARAVELDPEDDDARAILEALRAQ